jgi:glycosyltransferase involved in cell wall biosynthesis
VDYDDAIFHQYDLHPNPLVRTMLQKKIDTVMRHAALVIVGNDYLAERASEAGARWVEILPTVIDIERYTISGKRQNNGFNIGWIGTPMTAKYLYRIKDALVRICLEEKAQLLLVGLEKIDIEGVPVKTFQWSEEKEVELIQMFDVGIMPLPDNPWERGKCGYKLIQYMACSLPVIASPVGANRKIVDDGINGYLASTETEWLESFHRLQQDKRLRTEMGKAGRAKVESKYCLQVTAPRLAELLDKVASK